ncbi:MAG TPA: Gfo/Idh/MocA family oxidoreductase [Gaiellaceae bacterium]
MSRRLDGGDRGAEVPALPALERRSARVGIVGCGVISRIYARGADAFDSYEIVACADVDPACATRLADEFALEVATVDELLASDVDVVLNLTPPFAHAEVILRALEAGKHVYTEKTLTTTLAEARQVVEEAERRGLRLGSAPDTFLSGAFATARRLVDEGAIGEPRLATATFLSSGPDGWHPNADIFYRAGAGPLLDMGPYYLTAIAALCGPYARVAGHASVLRPDREIATGPRAGERFGADVPTHVGATIELAGGALAQLTASFELTSGWVAELALHGSEGSLRLPDPNTFDGPLAIRTGRGEWEEVAVSGRGDRDTRGIGLDDMLRSLAQGVPHRASGRLALHVLETACAIVRSADEGRTIELDTTIDAVEPLAA